MLRELPEGYTVRYRHGRRYADRTWPYIKDSLSLLPKGSRTEARILDSEGNEIATGEAVCRPDENFKKALGRTIALGRALQQLERTDHGTLRRR